VIVVVGTSIIAELLDRPVAELLRDEIDRLGGEFPYRRAVVLTHDAWYAEAEQPIIANNPVIAVGGPPINRLSEEFDKWVAPPGSTEGKYTIPGEGALTGFFRKNKIGLPQVSLWGRTASATRKAVEHYLKSDNGLKAFLKMSWK
jgi:hypothetical protein